MLTVDQRRWISARIVSPSDAHACEAAGVDPEDVPSWRLQPEFNAALDRAADDIVDAGKAYMEAVVAKAARRVDEALDAVRFDGSSDHKLRLDAARMTLQVSGLIRQKTEISGPSGKPLAISRAAMNVSDLSDEELNQLAGLLEKTNNR